MSVWSGCPVGLYNLYMEAGEVRAVAVEGAPCVYVEVWVCSVFSKNCVRPECRAPVRRTIYDVVKQIRKLSGGKPVCLVFLSDDRQDDPADWSVALWLLVQQLEAEGLLGHALLYTKKTPERLEAFGRTVWRTEQDRERFLALFARLDAVVYGQANPYQEAPGQVAGKGRSLQRYCKAVAPENRGFTG